MFRVQDRQKCQFLFDRYYKDRKFQDALYGERIERFIKPGDRVLDAGCGRYMKFCKRLSVAAQLTGIDLDAVLETTNTAAPYGVRGDLGHLPFPPGHFNMIISRSVVEHLEDPAQVFREFNRVLRPGGRVIIMTPNRYDYVSVIAALTPYRLHRALVSRLFRVSEDDVFPTLYRANTLRSLTRAFRMAGFSTIEIGAVNHYPAYLMFSPVLFRLGVLYERLTSSLSMFEYLRGLIIGVFEKRTDVTPAPSRPLMEST